MHTYTHNYPKKHTNLAISFVLVLLLVLQYFYAIISSCILFCTILTNPKKEILMKTLPIRLSDSDHAKLLSVSKSERIPMANLLMRLFDQFVESKKPRQDAHKPINKRDKAMADYAVLCAALPQAPTLEEATDARDSIKALRVVGGNVPYEAMPTPRVAVDAINRSIYKTGLSFPLTHGNLETEEDLAARFKKFHAEETQAFAEEINPLTPNP